MGRFRSTTTRVRGLQIFWRYSDGPAVPGGPPIVLVHGIGVTGTYMLPLTRLLARRYNTYVPNLPGWAQSGNPGRALDMSQLAHWLAAWMDAIGLERAVLIGNSMGCQIVVEFGALYPGRLQAAVLLGPTVDRAARSWLRQFARLMNDNFREPITLHGIIALDYLRMGPVRFLRTFRHALRHPMLQRARVVSAPTLVLRGARDPIASQRWVEELAAALPRGEAGTIPGSPHALNFSAAHKTAARLWPFLQRNHQTERRMA